jgi:hypothetical protein
MTHAAWKFLGSDDSIDTCDCCGRTCLKSTVALESNVTGDVVHYGVTCAARALKWGVKDVKAARSSADVARDAAERAARDAAVKAETARWFAWLDSKVLLRDWSGSQDVLGQIAALGGATKAREMYRSEK